MTVDQALAEIEKITMRGKQHLDDSERAKLRVVLDDFGDYLLRTRPCESW